MSESLSLYGQLALTHALIMGAITFFTFDQASEVTSREKAFLLFGWLVPVVGPIVAGILILVSRRKRS